MAISKWIGGFIILAAFVVAGKSQASSISQEVSLAQVEITIKPPIIDQK